MARDRIWPGGKLRLRSSSPMRDRASPGVREGIWRERTRYRGRAECDSLQRSCTAICGGEAVRRWRLVVDDFHQG